MQAMNWHSGYVLHLRPLSDSRKIIDILTADAGRITAVVRLNKKSSPLQPFQPYLFTWLGKQEMKTITGFESQGLSWSLQGEFLYCGFYLNELLQRLVPPGDEAPALFTGYEAVLAALAKGLPPELPLRQFELDLLRYLGYEYSFSCEGYSGQPIHTEVLYRFVVQQGFMPVAPNENLGTRHKQPIFRGSDILSCAAGEVSVANLRLLKWVCRTALRARLGREPLKSRDLFQGK